MIDAKREGLSKSRVEWYKGQIVGLSAAQGILAKRIDKLEDIEKYMKKYPMPEDPAYTKEDLIADIAESNGFYCLPANTKQETRGYVAELLNELMKR